jgi:hypothetical protein
MSGQKGRVWTLLDRTFTSEADYVAYAKRQERRAHAAFDQMEAEEAANGKGNGGGNPGEEPPDGHANGQGSVADDQTQLEPSRASTSKCPLPVAGVEPMASPRSELTDAPNHSTSRQKSSGSSVRHSLIRASLRLTT